MVGYEQVKGIRLGLMISMNYKWSW